MWEGYVSILGGFLTHLVTGGFYCILINYISLGEHFNECKFLL